MIYNSMNYVYQIKINGVVRYIGKTDNIKRRQSQHNRDYLKGSNKYLYKKIRELGYNDFKIELEVIKEFENKGDCSRWEAYLILQDYFGDKQLYQSFPVSIKYF